jgi:hypothetical protein
MPLESGIILPVPEAAPVVDRLRHLHDPQSRYGVPAHITLLYPFAHPSQVGGAASVLHQLFGLVPVFDFSLVEVRRFPATAYLRPEPSGTFVRLTETLACQWPEFPPYRGLFPTVIPHLTVADHAALDAPETVEAAVSGHLPIACRATEAWLMCSDEHGLWSVREVFRLQRS